METTNVCGCGQVPSGGRVKGRETEENGSWKRWWRTAEQHRLLLCVKTAKTWIDDVKESLEKVKYNRGK